MITRRRFLKALVAAPAAILLPSLVLAKPDIHTMVLHHTAKRKLMYLEVSARRAGKTRRLFNNMRMHIATTGEDVYFITGTHSMYHHLLKDNIHQDYWHKVKQLPIELSKREDIRYYYDEADLVDKELRVIKQNAYYVGTPHGKDNWLYELAQHNDMQYEKYTPYYKDRFPEDWTKEANWPTDTMYNQEVLGKFQ